MLTGKELANIVSPIDERTTSLTDKARPYVIGALPMAPVVAEEAKGAVIKDVQGNTYIDMFAGVGVLSLGHCPDKVVKAVQDQVSKIICTMVNYTTYAPPLLLAEKLGAIGKASFGANYRTVFSSSGSEAVENAVKVAKAATGRHGIICLENSFHGRTLLTGAMTYKCAPQKNGFGPQPSELYRLPSYYYYRYAMGRTKEQYIADLLEEAEFKMANAFDFEDIACMCVEGLQGEGGFLPQPVEYLQGLKKLCEKYGILYIADEIQSGFCRTGKWFCHEYAGFAPDIMTTAKSMAAGLPLAATWVKEEYDKCKPGQLGGTYMGNAVACAASNAAIDEFHSFDYCARALEIGKYMTGRIEQMQKKHAQIGDIRGIGAMLAMEIVEDPATKKPSPALLNSTIAECRKRGMVVLQCGIRGNVMRFLPTLVMTDEQMAQAMDILEASCDAVLK
jgi:4-aminobutyrate aminotransferase/(S)-3-amino-2-methylpropionate transaminase